VYEVLSRQGPDRSCYRALVTLSSTWLSTISKIPGNTDTTLVVERDASDSAGETLADADAVARTLAGDPGAFALLVHRYTGIAHAVAYAVTQSDTDADDVVQDAFLLAFRKLRTASDPQQFRAWLLRIVRNRAYNVVEFQRVRRYEVLSGAEPASDDSSPALLAERGETRAAIVQALSTIKPVLREVFLLHDTEGFTHAEIAALLGTSELMSRKHLMNARSLMRDALERYRSDQ
jgi:RNA polymerase sigma-70 factor, ECF subfamily